MSRKSDIDKKDDSGWPILFHAICNGRHQLVKWLIAKQASVLDKSKDGSTALMIAGEHGLSKIGHYLIKKDKTLINMTNDAENTALIVGLQHSMADFTIMMLSEYDCDVSVCNNEGDDAAATATEVNLGGLRAKIEAKVRSDKEAAEVFGH